MTIHHSPRWFFTSRSTISYAILAIVLVLMLPGCGGSDGGDADPASQMAATSQAASGNKVADSATIDASIRSNPCELLTAGIVADVFDVPATELEQSTVMSSTCTYTWESGDRQLEASVDVAGVYDDAEAASSRFRSVTAGLSGADLDRAMEGIKKEAARDAAGAGQVADTIVGGSGASGSKGIRFEDVEGVGDEARMALTVGAGDLYVRVGNLNFTVSGYYGPGMPMPAELTPGSIIEASNAWQQDSLPQRKEAAVTLAKAVVGAL